MKKMYFDKGRLYVKLVLFFVLLLQKCACSFVVLNSLSYLETIGINLTKYCVINNANLDHCEMLKLLLCYVQLNEHTQIDMV